MIPSDSRGHVHNKEQLEFSYDNDDDEGPPAIQDVDLADVNDDIDLGSLKIQRSHSALSLTAEMELQTIGVPDNVSTSPEPDDFNNPEITSLCEKTEGDPIEQDDNDNKVNIKETRVEKTRTIGTKRRTCLITVAITTFVATLVMVFVIPGRTDSGEKVLQQKLDVDDTPWAFDESEEFSPKDFAIIARSTDDATEELITTAIELLQEELELKVPFPPQIGANLVDIQQLPYDYRNEIPFFWQIPNSGSIMQSVMTACTHLVLASNSGDASNSEPETLSKVNVQGHEYVNVNLGHATGISHASDLGLSASGLADVLVSPHLHYASKLLFDDKHKGRAFTILRHPIERALSTYHVLQSHSTNEELKNMSIEDYVNSQYVETNWLTRFLVNRRQDGVIGYEQVALAKEVLRRKFLIGLYDHFEESIYRVEAFYGWEITAPPGRAGAAKLCHENMIKNARDRDKVDYDFMNSRIQYGDENYKILKEKNRYDLEVYWYAVELFKEQGLFLQEKTGLVPFS